MQGNSTRSNKETTLDFSHRRNMLEHRFVVFHCDDITRKSIAEYRKTAIGFFNLSEDVCLL